MRAIRFSGIASRLWRKHEGLAAVEQPAWFAPENRAKSDRSWQQRNDWQTIAIALAYRVRKGDSLPVRQTSRKNIKDAMRWNHDTDNHPQPGDQLTLFVKDK